MRKVSIPGTDLNVSLFCCGTGDIGSKHRGEEADRLLDAYRELGGNFFDTAHCYAAWTPHGAGCSERALADYFRRRGGRGDAVVATKGGHVAFGSYPRPDRYLSAETIAADLTESLQRLEADAIDLYWLHRDDPRVPAAEIIEFMNAEIRRGRIRHIGASNWAPSRLDEANRHAQARGLRGFVASQPQWSLAHVTECPLQTVFLDGEGVAWHRRSGMPVVCWSPTARGYFATGKAERAFENPLTRERLKRAQRLAADLDCTPTQVALAYLLSHPFPVIPILGTGRPEHLHEAVRAQDVGLTPAQAEWLLNG